MMTIKLPGLVRVKELAQILKRGTSEIGAICRSHPDLSPLFNERLCRRARIKPLETQKLLIPFDIATLIAQSVSSVKEIEYESKNLLPSEKKFSILDNPDLDAPKGVIFKGRPQINRKQRTPVITVMGHINHGKTSFLDSIRGTNIADLEPGGITQTTSVFTMGLEGREISNNLEESSKDVTLIDTPGHEIYFRMREKSTFVSDLVILVVAVDEGPQAQTLQSLEMAKDFSLPVIVALNKIDKPGTDPLAVLNQLLKITGQFPRPRPLVKGGAIVQESGRAFSETSPGVFQICRKGPIRFAVPVSIKEKRNVDLLFNTAVDVCHHISPTGEFAGPGEATVFDSLMAPGLGKVIKVVCRSGVIKDGDHFVVGLEHSRIRRIQESKVSAFNLVDPVNITQRISSLAPGRYGEIIGFNGNHFPVAGDMLHIVGSKDDAEKAISYRKLVLEYELQCEQLENLKKIDAESREACLIAHQALSEDEGARSVSDFDDRVRLILRCDSQSSLDALVDYIEVVNENAEGGNTRKIALLRKMVGPPSDADERDAKSLNARIIYFTQKRQNIQDKERGGTSRRRDFTIYLEVTAFISDLIKKKTGTPDEDRLHLPV